MPRTSDIDPLAVKRAQVAADSATHIKGASSCSDRFAAGPAADEKAKLVDGWIELQGAERRSEQYETLFWSCEQLAELTHNDPEIALEIIQAILLKNDSGKILANLAAGPLEDLLVRHGPTFIDRVESEASRNPRFRHLLGGVWQNAMTDEIWNRVQACWDRRGWDGIPE